MGEGTVVVTLGDVLVALKALREEVQMLRKLVQPVIGGPVLERPEKAVERPEKYPDCVPTTPYYPYLPQPPYPTFPAPWNPGPPHMTFASVTHPAVPQMMWNGRSP